MFVFFWVGTVPKPLDKTRQCISVGVRNIWAGMLQITVNTCVTLNSIHHLRLLCTMEDCVKSIQIWCVVLHFTQKTSALLQTKKSSHYFFYWLVYFFFLTSFFSLPKANLYDVWTSPQVFLASYFLLYSHFYWMPTDMYQQWVWIPHGSKINQPQILLYLFMWCRVYPKEKQYGFVVLVLFWLHHNMQNTNNDR